MREENKRRRQVEKNLHFIRLKLIPSFLLLFTHSCSHTFHRILLTSISISIGTLLFLSFSSQVERGMRGDRDTDTPDPDQIRTDLTTDKIK
jgi:hypothetical protein